MKLPAAFTGLPTAQRSACLASRRPREFFPENFFFRRMTIRPSQASESGSRDRSGKKYINNLARPLAACYLHHSGIHFAEIFFMLDVKNFSSAVSGATA
jgi:hypothetical protein